MYLLNWRHYYNLSRFIESYLSLILVFIFQVQAFLKIFTKEISLPSKEEMMSWIKNENERQRRENIPTNRYYHLSANIVEYFEDLTAYAQLSNIPPVLFKIFRQNERTYTENFYQLRRWNFQILDDHNYSASLKSTDY